MASCLWLLRWMLVLVLVADQVGAPLHRHHHDSGVDAIWASANGAAHEAHGHAHRHQHDDGDVAEDDHHDAPVIHAAGAGHPHAFGHATLAIRPSAASEVLAPASVPAADASLWAPLALLWPDLDPAPVDVRGEGPDFPRWRSPSTPSHRSLPPAGRAPPPRLSLQAVARA